MTNEEAIELLKDIANVRPAKKYALDLAIKALEKQIPKTLGDNFSCPSCGEIVGDGLFCEWCGQALDLDKEGEDYEQ